MVFDPFHDYAERGYLQNHFRLPDGRAIATLILASWVKHLSINRQLLASCDAIGYEEVLRVHRNFMAPIFPWGGMDRLAVMPDRAVRKGNIRFALPFEIRPMMEDVLYKAQRADQDSGRSC